MTEPQAWTLIGGFLAIMVFGTGLVLRIVRLEIQGLGARMDGRFGVIETKVDNLDRDVQALTRKVFHQDGS